MKRPDNASLVVIALSLVAFLVFLWIATTAPAKSVTVRAWAPLPSHAFLPIPPLVRPIPTASGSAGRNGSPPAGELTEPPSTPSSRPLRTIHPTSSSSGVATFYAYHQGQAAAAKRLRDAIGPSWRGTVVQVWYAGRPPLTVVLTDSESSTIPGRLIDLSEQDFARLAGPGWYQRGVLPVRVTW